MYMYNCTMYTKHATLYYATYITSHYSIARIFPHNRQHTNCMVGKIDVVLKVHIKMYKLYKGMPDCNGIVEEHHKIFTQLKSLS